MMQSLVNALEDSRIIKEGDKMAILVERNSADFIKLTSDKFDNHWKTKNPETNITETENVTTFQGVLEHYKSHDPDILCVVRRNRGFFIKKWEKNTILKRDFYSTKPVLVLSGLK